MLMFHYFRERTNMASREKFTPTPSKFLITAPDPSSKPAVTPCPPKRSYAWRRPYSNSIFANTRAGWTTSAAVLAYTPLPFEGRTPTALLRPHDERLNPSTDRSLYGPLQAHADPSTSPLPTILRNFSPYPSIPSC